MNNEPAAFDERTMLDKLRRAFRKLYKAVDCTIYERQYFINYLRKQFEPFMKSGKKQKRFDWTCVERIYNNSKNKLDDICLVRAFCSFVFKLLFLFECPDGNLVLKMIQLIIKHVSDDEVLMEAPIQLRFCCYCLHSNIYQHYVYENPKCLQSLLRNINDTENIYNLSNREIYSDLTIAAIHEGDYACLKFLVKYGLSCFPDDVLSRVRLDLELLNRKFHFCKQLRSIDARETDGFVESILTELLAKKVNMRRILLITIAVFISLSKLVYKYFYPFYVECFNLYALTVPEAAISLKDVESFLDLAFKNDRMFIEETYSNFKEIFPETPTLPSPRSLKELCRCKIRNCIQKSPTLTTTLSQMQIPRTVKNYLLFLRH